MKTKLSFAKRIFLRFFAKKHKYPTSCLIHRKTNSTLVFEIEFNWYDEDLSPVSIVRNVETNKVFSVRGDEMLEFSEYSGYDSSVGNTV